MEDKTYTVKLTRKEMAQVFNCIQACKWNCAKASEACVNDPSKRDDADRYSARATEYDMLSALFDARVHNITK